MNKLITTITTLIFFVAFTAESKESVASKKAEDKKAQKELTYEIETIGQTKLQYKDLKQEDELEGDKFVQSWYDDISTIPDE